jgi:hypothetical protein
MTATDLCRAQCAATARQLDAIYADISGAVLDAKLYPDFISPRETIAHLAECAVALQASLKGEQYKWGSYSSSASDFEGQKAEYKQLRAEAIDAAMAAGTDEAMAHVFDYIVLHDAYHVGQLAALRAQVEGWDCMAIYA